MATPVTAEDDFGSMLMRTMTAMFLAEAAPESRPCGGCEKELMGNEEAKCCSGCDSMYYCNEECFKKDWPEHKDECGQMRRNKDIENARHHQTFEPSIYTRDEEALNAVVQGRLMQPTRPLLCDNLICRRSLGATCAGDLEGPLLRCSKCKTAVYCSTECAKVCFKTHKKGCGTLQDITPLTQDMRMRVMQSCAPSKLTSALLDSACNKIASFETRDAANYSAKKTELEKRLCELSSTTLFFVVKHAGTHRKNERATHDRGMTMFQVDFDEPRVVSMQMLESLHMLALSYMYAEEDRLGEARYFKHGSGIGVKNPFQTGFPLPPGTAARLGGKVDKNSNLVHLGAYQGMAGSTGISLALRSTSGSKKGQDLEISAFRWETDGPFSLPEVAREDIVGAGLSLYLPRHLPQGVLVVETDLRFENLIECITGSHASSHSSSSSS